MIATYLSSEWGDRQTVLKSARRYWGLGNTRSMDVVCTGGGLGLSVSGMVMCGGVFVLNDPEENRFTMEAIT